MVKTSCGHRAHGVSIREKFVISRNMGYKTRGDQQVAKHSCDPPPPPERRYATGEPSKVQGRDRVVQGPDRVVIVEASCGSVFGKKCYIEKPGLQDEGVATG